MAFDNQSIARSAAEVLENLRLVDAGNPVRTVAVTSSVAGEGKSFVASALADAIADAGQTVLLVDANLRKPFLGTLLGVRATAGVASVAAGTSKLKDAICATSEPRKSLLVAEDHTPNPLVVFDSQGFAELLDEARKAFDYVVFDTPAVLSCEDAVELGTKVDATLLVVRQKKTRGEDITAATQRLQEGGAKLVGAVLNRVR